MDATTIVAYANPNRKHTVRNPGRPDDADASWTKKHSARDPSQRKWVFGDKAYVVADANHDVARGIVVTTASRNDSPFLPSPLAELASGHSWFSLTAGVVVIADRALSVTNPTAFLRKRPYPQPFAPAGARIRRHHWTPPCAQNSP